MPRKPAQVEGPNPHLIKPADHRYPQQGPVTVTYRNPRQKKNQKVVFWIHVDQVVHWMERDLWHHLRPIKANAEIINIQVGTRFTPDFDPTASRGLAAYT